MLSIESELKTYYLSFRTSYFYNHKTYRKNILVSFENSRKNIRIFSHFTVKWRYCSFDTNFILLSENSLLLLGYF